MMQTPSLLGYTNLTHLLEIRSQLAAAAAAAAARHHQQPPQMAAKRPTPFSIDAILGLENGPDANGVGGISKQQQDAATALPTHAALPLPGCGGADLSNKMESVPGGVGKRPKSKRVRTIFTPEQLERLEAEFERQQYMVGPERLYLAHALQLTEAQVKVWFQNRRIKWRKQHLEQQQQRLAALKHLQHHQQQHLQVPGGCPSSAAAGPPVMEAELEDSEDTSSHSGDELHQPRSSSQPL